MWQPGTDHAGIATQMVVERQLNAEGTHRRDLGREAFVERVWEWKAQSGDTISRQERRLGNSVDWSRDRFTMDEGLSPPSPKCSCACTRRPDLSRQAPGQLGPGAAHRAVRPRSAGRARAGSPVASALSARGRQRSSRRRDDAPGNDARRHRGRRASGRRALPASRRQADPPAAHRSPDSDHRRRVRRSRVRLRLREDHARPRLQRLRGRQAPRPAADQHLRRERRAQRRSAAAVSRPRSLRGAQARRRRSSKRSACSRRSSRTRCTVPRGDRSGAVLEPWLTDQWYVRIAPLAEPAIKAVEDGRIRFVPENWSKTYFQWMHNIQDWCISRQLWWGHQIPAWYDERRQHLRRALGSGSAGAGAREARSRREADARRGRARHLVLLRAVAVLDARLAGADAGAEDVLSDQRAGDRLRHHLLLGRAHDHDGPEVRRRRAVPRGLHHRADPRRARRQDVQVQGQHHRPARPDRRHRPRSRWSPSAPAA